MENSCILPPGHVMKWLLSISLLVHGLCCFGQQPARLTYAGSDGQRAFFPLGEVSFADEVTELKLGFPRPKTKFRDSSQALAKPNYRNYNSPDFVSLGCGGQITFRFVDNGFMNMEGKDLYIFEVGPAKERTKIEISTDGKTWEYAGIAAGGTSYVDFEDEGIDRNKLYHYLRLTDLKDECDGKSAGADIDAVGAVNSFITIDLASDVLFDTDKYELKSSAKQTLDSLLQLVRPIPAATIRVEGHTDSDGDTEYNQQLSQDRCESVIKALYARLTGRGDYTFEIIAHGELEPRVPNTSPENKQLNRRVEIVVLPPRLTAMEDEN
jgi:outer membrane protein OmpA-like peptidoglycan-associated protein